MQKRSRSNFYIAAAIGLFAVLALFIWIPLDTHSGIISYTRGRYVIGDGLAPSIAVIVMLLGALLIIARERYADDQPGMTLESLRFIALLAAIVFSSVILMRYAGPLAVGISNFLTGGEAEYRLLRDTMPWKYIGYTLGGLVQVAGTMALIEGRVTLRGVIVGIAAVAVMIAVFDLPFDNLLLPPNGGL